eukprot:8861168-Alexandrium_andersonii.AAC.1
MESTTAQGRKPVARPASRKQAAALPGRLPDLAGGRHEGHGDGVVAEHGEDQDVVDEVLIAQRDPSSTCLDETALLITEGVEHAVARGAPSVDLEDQ